MVSTQVLVTDLIDAVNNEGKLIKYLEEESIPYTGKGNGDGMPTTPFYLKEHSDGMATSPFYLRRLVMGGTPLHAIYRRLVMGWPPLHCLYRGRGTVMG